MVVVESARTRLESTHPLPASRCLIYERASVPKLAALPSFPSEQQTEMKFQRLLGSFPCPLILCDQITFTLRTSPTESHPFEAHQSTCST